MNFRPSALLPTLALAAIAANAAPINLADVPSSSAWFAHLDCEKASVGKLGQALETLRSEIKASLPESERAAVDAKLNLLNGVTAYGTGEPNNTVFLLHCRGKSADARAVLLAGVSSTERVIDGMTLQELNLKNNQGTLFLVTPETGPAILATKPEDAVAATKRTVKPIRVPGEWTAFTGPAAPVFIVSGFIEKLPHSALQSDQLKQLKTTTLGLDLSDNRIRIQIKGTAVSPAAATSLADTAKAFVSLAKSSDQSDKNMADTINSLKVNVEGPIVSIDAGVPLDALKVSTQVEQKEGKGAEHAAGDPMIKIQIKSEINGQK